MTQAPNSGKKIQNYIFNYSDFLGKGNFSKCYKATNIKTQQVVAIKIVELNSLKSKKLEELLFQQIAILKELNHPNVLRCLEVFTSNRNCYIITENCNQGDLQTRIKKKGALDSNEVKKMLADVYNGLLYLTSKGIIHRDLKIANVFLHEGRAKIADFGFAMHCSGNFQDLNIGSPLYMSPEGFLKNTYGLKTDVWSFGIMVYQLYHNRTPFCGCRTEKDLKAAIVTPIRQNNLKASIPQEVKQLILACLQISEEKRPLMSDLKKYAYIQQIMKISNSGTQPAHFTPPPLPQKSMNTIRVEQQAVRMTPPIMRSQQRSRTMDNFNSPAKVVYKGPSYLTNLKDVKGSQQNYQSLHQNIYNSTEFKFQSPQVKKQNGYTLDSSNHGNGSVHWIPLSSQRNRFQSDQLLKTQPISVHGSQSYRCAPLINCELNFKQSVSLIHYCRMIFKYLQLYKQFTYLRQTFQKKHYAILGHYLLMILDDINRQIINKKIRYDGNNPELREKKLNEVNSEYRKKYADELGQSILQQYLSPEEKGHLSIHAIRQVLESTISNTIVPEDCSNREAIIGELLLTIYSSTTLIEQSSSHRNYQIFQKNKDIEEILNRSTNLFNYTSYIRHKNQVFNMDHMITV